jgi:Protein of unknown function (DUF3263)
MSASKSSTSGGFRNTLVWMLSEDDRAILEFERGWWLEPGPKDQAIEFSLGLTAASYYERLIELVAGGAAAVVDPLTVARVRSIIQVDVRGEAVS